MPRCYFLNCFLKEVSTIKTLFKDINQRKVKVFLLFLICSFLAWAVSKFSETYESRASFDLEYYNLPDTLLLNPEAETAISAKVRATGFQFLGYSLNSKTIRVNLEHVLQEEEGYFLTANTLKNTIEPQLPNRVTLLELVEPIYFIDLYEVGSKKVRVKPEIAINLVQNHMLIDEITVVPDSVSIKGAKESLAKIRYLTTELLQLEGISKDFTRKVSLSIPDSLDNVFMGIDRVQVNGRVERFSEKEFLVTVKAVNTPAGYRLRFFPNQIKLVCKAGIERLSILNPSDFNVVADYTSHTELGGKRLYLELGGQPEGVFAVRLLREDVEFVLEKL